MILFKFFIAIFAIFISPHIYLYCRYPHWKYSIVLMYGFIISLSGVWILILFSYYTNLSNIFIFLLAVLLVLHSLWYMYQNKHQCREANGNAFLWIIAILLLLSVFYHAGSGFVEWDALVSWNRWGLELYNNEYHPINAAYPILIPALYGIIYKIQGSNEIWWTAKMVLFVFPLVVLVLPMVLYREYKTKTFLIITLLIYPYLLMPKVIEGAVDMPVMIMGMLSLIALYAAEINKENKYFEHYSYGALLIAGLSSITKQPGLAFVVFVLLYMMLNLKHIADKKKFIFISTITLSYFLSFLSIYYLNASYGATGNLEYLESLSEYSFAHKNLLLEKFFGYPSDLPIFEPLVKFLQMGVVTPYLLTLALLIFISKGIKKYDSISVLSLVFLIAGFFAWGKYASYHERNSYWVKTFLIMFVAINFNYFISWYNRKKISPVFIYFTLIIIVAILFAAMSNDYAYAKQKAFQTKLGRESIAKNVAHILKTKKPCTKIYTNDYSLLYNYHTKDFKDRIIAREFDAKTLRESIENNCSEGAYILFRISTHTYPIWIRDISRLIYDKKILPYKDTSTYFYYIPANTKVPGDYFEKRTTMFASVKVGKVDTNVTYMLESIKDDNLSIMINGWAFVKNAKTDYTKKYIILEKANKRYTVISNVVLRSDVTKYFKAKDLVHAGFKSYLYKKDFTEGIYDMSLLLIEENGKQHLIKTKKKLNIEYNTHKSK